MVAENLEIVRKRIQNACRRCNRRPEDIILVGVTKTFGPETVQQAIAAGLFDVGENYVQELTDKRNQVPDETVRWHFIGHLQSNKVKYIAGFIHLIHSVDNDSVAVEIDKRGEKSGRTIDVLIEVHSTDEATKFGVRPDKTLELIKRISQFGHLRVRGLMTMGPFSDDPNDSRPSFQQLAALQKDIAREEIRNVTMDHLSMGMSHDFEVAIEEGATIVRVGTAIFGKRTSRGTAPPLV